jgi:hypothetical protein
MTYSCKNRQRPTAETSYWAQDGWFYDESGMTRKPRMVKVSTAFDFACQHDKSADDPVCAGCQWRKEK